jgi:hypothetical protein
VTYPTSTHLATAADYADALLTARRAKSLVSLLLLLVLLIQIAMFFLLRYWRPLPAGVTPMEIHTRSLIQYFVGLLDIAGLLLPAILTVILYLILKVQLVGRLLGTAHLTSAFLWSILFALLLFPWQAVLNNPSINADPNANAIGMKIPGVLYTWAEISHPIIGARFSIDEPAIENSRPAAILHWARYAGFPVLALTILTMIHLKSQRGLRLSLGEAKISDATNPAV